MKPVSIDNTGLLGRPLKLEQIIQMVQTCLVVISPVLECWSVNPTKRDNQISVGQAIIRKAVAIQSITNKKYVTSTKFNNI